MVNPMTFYEGFGWYTAEQRRMINYIREANISGVMFLSGDRHHSEPLKRIEPDLYPLYEFTSSPLTSDPANPTREENNPARVPGTLVKRRSDFGLIVASGPANARKLLLRTLDAAGKELWRHEIKASELTFPQRSVTN